MKIEEDLADIEESKNDSRKMFKAIKMVRKEEPKKPLLVNSEHGVTTNEEKQVKSLQNTSKKLR